MNLAAILSSKIWISNFLLIGFLLFPVNTQIAQEKEAVEQTSFSMEFPFERAVPLSEAAKRTLATDRSVAHVMKDDQLSIESIPKDWFSSSEVHLGPKGETDLVIMGTGISLGPYSTGFWILRRTPQGYEIVLAVHTHSLALLDSSSNVFRDIETVLPTGGQSYVDKCRFDGHTYQKAPPAVVSQSVFAMEGEPVSAPVDLPEDALQALRKTKFVLSCLENDQTPQDIPASWFVASEIHLGGAKEIDLVVQPSTTPSSNCLLHAHSMPFWVLRGTESGFTLVLEDHTQELEILNTRSNGFPDITTSLSTTVGVTETLFKFDGNEYKLYERNTKFW